MSFVDDWLEPALQGIESILTSGAVDLGFLETDIGVAASRNIGTTAVLMEGAAARGSPLHSWALVNAYGLGHAALIGADVSDDRLVDRSPNNARWILNLMTLLAQRSRETAGWAGPVQQQKPVDIPNLGSDARIGDSFRYAA